MSTHMLVSTKLKIYQQRQQKLVQRRTHLGHIKARGREIKNHKLKSWKQGPQKI